MAAASTEKPCKLFFLTPLERISKTWAVVEAASQPTFLSFLAAGARSIHTSSSTPQAPSAELMCHSLILMLTFGGG